MAARVAKLIATAAISLRAGTNVLGGAKRIYSAFGQRWTLPWRFAREVSRPAGGSPVVAPGIDGRQTARVLETGRNDQQRQAPDVLVSEAKAAHRPWSRKPTGAGRIDDAIGSDLVAHQP